MPTSNICLKLATDKDMEEIYKWLVDHDKRNVHGSFLCNWGLTQKVHNEEKVIIASIGDKPIAYMWLNFGIVEVREDYRRNGVGRKLVEYALKIASNSDAVCVNIECSPQTSISFWEHMGFHVYGENHAYFIIGKSFNLPDDAEPIDVEISFYPESKMWEPETIPMKVFSPPARKTPDGKILLGKRVAICATRSIWNGDSVLGIKISGDEVYLGKAKHQRAKDIGVQCKNGACAIEQINA